MGCGNTAPDGWVNCDSSWNAQISKWPILHRILVKLNIVSHAQWPPNVRYLRLGSRFPWPDGSADVVYASHVFEHLDRATRHNFMKESYRVLKPGGVLRIVVPDLLYHAKTYVESWSEVKSCAEAFLEVIHLRFPEEQNIIRRIYYFVTDYPTIHKDMYDQVTLRDIFILHGFKDIYCSAYGKSHYLSNICDVEFRENSYEGSIYMEGVKPKIDPVC